MTEMRCMILEQKRQLYSRTATGERIRRRRKLLGLSRKELAGRVGKAEKYCADIERGYCGMSLETMIGLAECLGMSLDYLILGKDGEERINREVERIWFLVKDCDERRRKKAMELLKVYLNE